MRQAQLLCGSAEVEEMLPLEVWTLVLAQPPLTLVDLARAASACRAFRQLIGSISDSAGVTPSQSRLQAVATARQWRLVTAREEHPIVTLAIGSAGTFF
jgi:hypothetical protein